MGSGREQRRDSQGAGQQAAGIDQGQARGPMSEGGFEAGYQANSPQAQSAETQAEIQRLSTEMTKLAQRNAWGGVERAYQQLMALGPIEGHLHALGALAAQNTGDTRQTQQRLRRARTAGHDVEADLDLIDQFYGRVRLASDTERPRSERKAAQQEAPVLSREGMPFAPDQRKSVEFAQGKMAETWSFSGMVPLGNYTLSHEGRTREFEVYTGADLNLSV